MLVNAAPGERWRGRLARPIIISQARRRTNGYGRGAAAMRRRGVARRRQRRGRSLSALRQGRGGTGKGGRRAAHGKASSLQHDGDPAASGEAQRDAEVAREVALKRRPWGNFLHETTLLKQTCLNKISTYLFYINVPKVNVRKKNRIGFFKEFIVR